MVYYPCDRVLYHTIVGVAHSEMGEQRVARRALVRHQIWSRDSSSNFLAADAEDTTRSEAPLPTNSSSDRARRMYFLLEE